MSVLLFFFKRLFEGVKVSKLFECSTKSSKITLEYVDDVLKLLSSILPSFHRDTESCQTDTKVELGNKKLYFDVCISQEEQPGWHENMLLHPFTHETANFKNWRHPVSYVFLLRKPHKTPNQSTAQKTTRCADTRVWHTSYHTQPHLYITIVHLCDLFIADPRAVLWGCFQSLSWRNSDQILHFLGI